MKSYALKLLGWAGATLALLATFSLYQQPGFLLLLAHQAWTCF